MIMRRIENISKPILLRRFYTTSSKDHNKHYTYDNNNDHVDLSTSLCVLLFTDLRVIITVRQYRRHRARANRKRRASMCTAYYYVAAALYYTELADHVLSAN